MFNILDFGAKADGVSLSTKAIQKAVDACHKCGGGTVFIPAGGAFVCGTVHLRDNIHVMFENGAILYGSKNLEDFDPIEKITCLEFQDRSHSFFRQSLFYAENCDNISFSGIGKIDMQSAWQDDHTWRKEQNLLAPKCANPDYDYEYVESTFSVPWHRGAKVISLKECNDIVIKDLIINNATDLAVYFAGCENVRVTGLNIHSHIDGISPDACKNVVISDCIVNTGDDAIVAKSSYSVNKLKCCENITITNCVIKSWCNAIKFGTESIVGFKNITISNCTITETRFSGIAIESVDGATFDGINISNITMKNVGNPLLMLVLFRGQAPVGTPIGTIRNITLSNITAVGPYEEWRGITCRYTDSKLTPVKPYLTPMLIVGQPDSMIEKVTLSNINITMPGGGTEEDKNIILKEVRCEYPECAIFGDKHPAYALFARHVKNFKLYNVNFDTYEDDKRDAIVVDRVIDYKNV